MNTDKKKTKTFLRRTDQNTGVENFEFSLFLGWFYTSRFCWSFWNLRLLPQSSFFTSTVMSPPFPLHWPRHVNWSPPSVKFYAIVKVCSFSPSNFCFLIAYIQAHFTCQSISLNLHSLTAFTMKSNDIAKSWPSRHVHGIPVLPCMHFNITKSKAIPKRSGESMHSCFTQVLLSNHSLRSSLSWTAHWLFLYISEMMSMILNGMP